MTGDIGAAEGAVAEAYMKAWQRWSHLQRYEIPQAWVRTVATTPEGPADDTEQHHRGFPLETFVRLWSRSRQFL